ncbi:iron-containing alcohol dehydrogenase [[Clostridium] innocuum]|nr:iron-containing alcohol dehydrogenase [[Clostridium] innocuum]
MNKFTYTYPTKVYFGKGSAKDALTQELNKYGNTILLAYGGGSIKKNGIYEEVVRLLKENHKTVIEFSGIMSNPTYQKVQEGVELVKKFDVDFILAVGGGSVIDCCKVISAQACLDEDIWEMEYKKGKFPTDGISIGAVVTASGTGAEMNGGAVITHEEKKWKGGIYATTPSFAVLDPSYTMSVPRMQVLSGAFDTLSHAMETYFGNSDQDNVSDDVSLSIMKNTVDNIQRLLTDIHDEQARGNLMWDSAMAENGILKCGRQTDFQVHQIEHQLAAYTDCNHGQGLAVIQPVYYRNILNDAREKLTKFARVVFQEDSAEKGLDALSDLIKECGLPTKLSELKTMMKITPDLLKQVADTTNIIQTNPKILTKDDVYHILMECM